MAVDTGGILASGPIDWPALAGSAEAGVLLHLDVSIEQVASCCRGRLNYLATPYSLQVLDEFGVFSGHLSCLMQMRAARWSRAFAVLGVTAVSPIVQAVDLMMCDHEGAIDPLDDAFWTRWCAPMLAKSEAVIVPPIEGWQESRGVWFECVTALRRAVPVYLLAEGDV